MFGLGEGAAAASSSELGWGLKQVEGESANVSFASPFFSAGGCHRVGRELMMLSFLGTWCRGRRRSCRIFERFLPSETRSASSPSPRPTRRRFSPCRTVYGTTSLPSLVWLSTIRRVRLLICLSSCRRLCYGHSPSPRAYRSNRFLVVLPRTFLASSPFPLLPLLPFPSPDGRALVKLVPASTLIEAREAKLAALAEKASKAAALKQAKEAAAAAKLERISVLPSQMFKPPHTPEGTYSAWDDRGLPTKDGEGAELSKSKVKGNVKLYETRKKERKQAGLEEDS
jgi:hypothetical protein